MSVDGWSELGTSDMICVDPGGTFVSSVFLGYPWPHPQPADPVMPSVTIGASDFSIECWVRKKFGNNPGEDEQFWTGLLANDVPSSFPNPAACFRWGPLESSAIQLWFARVPGTAPIAMISTALMSELTVWHHLVGNFDRDGNMELFRDNVSEGATSIAAQAGAQAATEIHALTSDHAFNAHNDDPTATGDYAAFPVMIGPMAIHNRLMTAVEREASLTGKTVQNFGSAITLARYEWRDFEGETGWDSGMERMMSGHKFGLSVPGAIPFGAPGTVTARDSSGNNRHWILPTQATVEDYEARVQAVFAAESGHWPLCFGVDLEFR